jgi:hypothetical protein
MPAIRQKLPMDSRKRITLRRLLLNGEDISSFEAYREGDKIILIPMSEIPASELWLYKNKEALASVKRGLAQKKTHDRGSFAKYADDDI